MRSENQSVMVLSVTCKKSDKVEFSASDQAFPHFELHPQLNQYGLPARYGILGFLGGIVGALISDLLGLGSALGQCLGLLLGETGFR